MFNSRRLPAGVPDPVSGDLSWRLRKRPEGIRAVGRMAPGLLGRLHGRWMRLGYLHGQLCWDLLVLWGMLSPALAALKAEQVLDGRHSIGEGTNEGLPWPHSWV